MLNQILLKKNLLYFQRYNSELYSKLIKVKQHVKLSQNYSIDIQQINTISSEIFLPTFQKHFFTKKSLKSIKNIKHLIYKIDQNPTFTQKIKIFKSVVFGTFIDKNQFIQIHNNLSSNLYFIIEPDINIFYNSCYNIDWEELSQYATFLFCVTDNENILQNSFYQFFQYNFNLNYTINIIQLNKNYNNLYNYLSKALTSNNPLSHSYNVKLHSYKNHIKNSKKYYYIDFKEKLFSNKNNIIIVSIGPSIKDTIEQIKQNREKLVIVAYAQTLSLLQQHNITPDIITVSDSSKKMLEFFNIPNQKAFLSKTILFANSEVDPKILKLFKKTYVYLFNKAYHNLIGSTIGEITYHLILKLGGENIFLAGVDLAFDKNNKLYHNSHKFEKDIISHSLTKDDPKAIQIEIKGNLQQKVKTNIFFKTIIDNYNLITLDYLDRNIYNLSNGAFLENIIPLEKLSLKNGTNNIKIKSTKYNFNKIDLKDELDFLNSLLFTNIGIIVSKELFLKQLNNLTAVLLTISNSKNLFSIQRQHILFNYFNITLNFVNYFVYSNKEFNYTQVYNEIIFQLKNIIMKYKKILQRIE